MRLTWASDVLRAAGLQVYETPGWRERGHGEFPASISGVWHHDASQAGDSPGALQWMLDNWANASANFWVNRAGAWFVVGAGVAWHTGTVQPGCPGNYDSFGVETDQTIREVPTPAMLESTRRGIAALLRHMGRDESSAWFHKIIARPAGRKIDPWFTDVSNNPANWPAELEGERRIMRGVISGAPVDLGTIVAPPAPAPTPAPAPLDRLPVRQGSRGEVTRSVQRLLIARGFLPGGADDGAFGPQTLDAVLRFQRSRGLVDDGVVGAATYGALQAAAAPVPYPGVLLRRGSTGLAVATLQRRLGIAVDGEFGPMTEAAVRAAQVRAGFTGRQVDGIVGRQTHAALFGG